jgi:hypothetical protein
MSRQLTTNVHAVELDEKGQQTGQAGVFGPGDDLPDWARKSITNPDVWAGPEDDGDKPAARGRRAPTKDDK